MRRRRDRVLPRLRGPGAIAEQGVREDAERRPAGEVRAHDHRALGHVAPLGVARGRERAGAAPRLEQCLDPTIDVAGVHRLVHAIETADAHRVDVRRRRRPEQPFEHVVDRDVRRRAQEDPLPRRDQLVHELADRRGLSRPRRTFEEREVR